MYDTLIAIFAVPATVTLPLFPGAASERAGPISTWTAGPLIEGHYYSSPIAVDASGSFMFPISAPGVHYVTRASGSLAGKSQIRMRYRIDADPTAIFRGANDGKPVTTGPILYLQRAGDDWSGNGEFASYRWWAGFAIPPLVADGQEHEIVAPFSSRWTNVNGGSSIDNPQAFAAALANAKRVGFTFPSDTGYGHGCYVSNPVRFTVLEFSVE